MIAGHRIEPPYGMAGVSQVRSVKITSFTLIKKLQI